MTATAGPRHPRSRLTLTVTDDMGDLLAATLTSALADTTMSSRLDPGARAAITDLIDQLDQALQGPAACPHVTPVLTSPNPDQYLVTEPTGTHESTVSIFLTGERLTAADAATDAAAALADTNPAFADEPELLDLHIHESNIFVLYECVDHPRQYHVTAAHNGPDNPAGMLMTQVDAIRRRPNP